MKNSAPRRDQRGRLTGGNPRNSGGKRGRSGRPPAEFREWALAMRDTAARKVVEQVLGDPRHRDRFKAVEYVTKYAVEAERVVTEPQLNGLVQEFIAVIQRHVPEPDRLNAIHDDFKQASARAFADSQSGAQ